MSKISITFLAPKGRINKANQVTILCRLTQKNDRKDLSTGVSIPPNLWDKHKHKAKGTTQLARTANEKLEAMERDLEAIILEANRAKETLTPEILRQRYQNPTPNHTLLSLWAYYIKHMTLDKAEGTLRTYETRENNIRAFLKDKLQVKDLPYQDITFATASELYLFLRTKKNAKRQNNGHDFCAKVVMFLRSAFDFAYKSGLVDKNVWVNVEYGQKNDKKLEYLTFEELKQIASKEFDIPRLQRVADLFVFQASCGLAYIDFANLKSDNLKTNPHDGKIWIYTDRQKTDNQVVTPILPFGQKILEKYEGIENLPKLANECYNRYLKDLANVMGIKINLTTHIARKTFATLCLNEYNIPIETVSKVLGHSSITTTQRSYAKVNVGKISKDFGEALGGIA